MFQTTYNKHKTVEILREEGLPVVRSLLIESAKAAKEEMMDSVKKAVGFPCIVKPNRGAANTNQLISTLVSRSEGKWGGAEGCSGPGLQTRQPGGGGALRE